MRVFLAFSDAPGLIGGEYLQKGFRPGADSCFNDPP
jgi:hypothetical protein